MNKNIIYVIFIITSIASIAMDEPSTQEAAGAELDVSVAVIDERPIAGPFEFVIGRLHQDFVYGTRRTKDVFWSDMYEKFPEKSNSLAMQATLASLLEADEIDACQIKGFDDEKDAEEATVYSLRTAQQRLRFLVNNFISQHESEFVKNTSLVESVTPSVVVAPCPACSLQMHRACFKAAAKAGREKCTNSFCSTPWTKEVYHRALAYRTKEQRKRAGSFVIEKTSIYDADCHICQMPLKVEETAAAATVVCKRKR